MPERRIIDQDLWDAAKAQQDTTEGSTFGESNTGHIVRRFRCG